MTLTIHNTEQIVEVNGIPARVWEGKTDTGIEVQCLVTRVAVHKSQDFREFERELRETPAPAMGERAFPLRMVLE